MMATLILEDLNLDAAEKRLCEEALHQAGSIAKAAVLLGISRRALRRRIVTYDIQWKRHPPNIGLHATAIRPQPISSAPASSHPAETRPTMSKTVQGAERAFSWLAILAPHRVWAEEVGDALETIASMERNGASVFRIKVKIWSTIFWVLLNGVRELFAGLSGRKSPHK